MHQALSNSHLPESADCEIELQATYTAAKSLSTDAGSSDSETGAVPPGAAGSGAVAHALHVHLQIRLLLMLADGMVECVIRKIHVQKQDRDVILRLHGIENVRCALILLAFNALKNLFFMRHYTVWTAEVSLADAAPDADVEVQEHGRCLVVIHRSSHHPELTSALHHNGRLGNMHYVQDRLPGIIVTNNSPWPQGERRGALYLKAEASKGRALIWFTFAVVASAGVGVAAGLCTKDAGIGLAVGAVAIAAFSGLQAILYGKIR